MVALHAQRDRAMILNVENIDVFYGETQALFDVSLSVNSGEVVALLGPNGAGKTTTLRSVLGLTPLKRGRITFDGEDISQTPTHIIARRGIGWVPEERRVFPTLTVERNLSIAIKNTRFKSWTMNEIFDLLTPLRYLRNRECENLSGGELQMVAIARALLGSPGLVLLDEPSQGLAPKIVHDVLQLVQHVREEGISVMIVDQNTTNIMSIVDRVYVMQRGEIIYSGPASELAEDHARREELIGV